MELDPGFLLDQLLDWLVVRIADRIAERIDLPVGPSGDGLLDVTEAAELLGVSKEWLYKNYTELPHVRVGRAIRFDRVRLYKHMQG